MSEIEGGEGGGTGGWGWVISASLVAHTPHAGADRVRRALFSKGGRNRIWPSQRCFGGDKLGTVSQMGTLEWVKPALKRAVPFSPTVTVHTSIHAELRAPLAEIQKGQNHSFTLPHSHLCIPSVHECMYCTATLKTHTRTHIHTQAGTRLLPSGRAAWLHRLPRPIVTIGTKAWLDIVQMQF